MAINYSPHIVSDGLVLCLDAANPRSYPGSGNTWYDLSGNGYHFNKGNSTFNGKGFTFSSGSNYAYEITQGIVPLPSYDYTICCFAKPTSFVDTASNCGLGSSTLFSWNYTNGSIYKGISMGYIRYAADGSNSRISTSAWVNSSANAAIYRNNTRTEDFLTGGRTHFYAMRSSYNSSTNTTTISTYFDGVTLGASSGTGETLTPGRFFIAGGNPSCSNGSLIGDFYSLFYYSRYLENFELEKIYNSHRGRYGI